ncbi:MAG: tetratricopeptide repeat protein [Bacteroidia bacterium]|nr:tetratricopeptide repeat protein [Bacteroidia bacterium]
MRQYPLFFLFLLTTFGIFCPYVSIAQENSLDSLVVLLKNAKHDSDKLRLLCELSEICEENDILTYAGPALELADKLLADPLFKNKREIFLQHKADALNNIGFIHQFHGEVIEALDFFHRSLGVQEEIDDKEGMANSLNSMAYIYEGQEEFEKAIETYSRSLKIREASGYKKGIASSLNNIGVLYFKQGNIELALEFYKRSLKLRQEIEDKTGIANSLYNIGIIYNNRNKLDSAMNYLQQSLTLRKELGDKGGVANSLAAIGGNYLAQNKTDEAMKAATASLEISQTIGYPDNIERAAALLDRVWRNKGNFKNALKYYEMFVQMRDSVTNEANRKTSIRKDYQYEYEKKAAAIKAEQDKKDALAEQDKKIRNYREFIIEAIGIIIFLILISIAIILYIRYKSKKRTSEELAIKNRIIETKNKEITDSIHYSKRIQQAILPPDAFIKNLLPESFVFFKPKDIVSGDFYWVEKFGKQVIVAAVDCTGHGVPGAFMSFVAYSLLNEAVNEHGITRPAVILSELRKGLFKMLHQSAEDASIKDGMDIAVCAIDLKTMKLEFAGAYNPLWIIRESECIELKADKIPIGAFISGVLDPFTNHEVDLKNGDNIYLFTDGYADQFGGPKEKKFKYQQMKDLLLSLQKKPMNEQHAALEKSFADWRGELEQIDDVCIIGFRL